MASKGNLGDMEGSFTLNRFAFVPVDELSWDEIDTFNSLLAEMDN